MLHKSKGMELLTKRFKLFSDQFGSEIETRIGDVMKNGEVAGTKVTIIVPDSLTDFRVPTGSESFNLPYFERAR